MDQYALVVGNSYHYINKISSELAAKDLHLVLVGENEIELEEIADVLARQFPVKVFPFAKELSYKGDWANFYETLRSKKIEINLIAKELPAPFLSEPTLSISIEPFLEATELFLEEMAINNPLQIVAVENCPSRISSSFSIPSASIIIASSVALENELKEMNILATEEIFIPNRKRLDKDLLSEVEFISSLSDAA